MAAAAIGALLGVAAMARRPARPAPAPHTPRPARATPTAIPGAGMTREQMLAPILQRGLFGTAKQDAQGDPDAPSDLPYLLLGTIVARPASHSSAWIVRDEAGREGHGYGIGDALDDDLDLVEIAPDHVVVQHDDGQRETLSLADTKALRSQAGPQKPLARTTGHLHWTVNDAALVGLYKDPKRAVGHVLFRPWHSGRTAPGVRLSRLMVSSPLHMIGLRRGDVVHSINGYPTTSKKDVLKALASLAHPSTFTVKVTRRRHDETFHYDVR